MYIKTNKYIVWTALILALLGLATWLRLVFAGDIILSQQFHIGPLTIHYYGLIMAGAIASAYWLLQRNASGYSMTIQDSETLVVVLIICGFVGARIYHVIGNYQYYINDPVSALYVWHGGLGIYGAVAGGVFGLLGFAYYKGWQRDNILLALDWLAPAVIVGQIIGRFGNLVNYEAFGYPTLVPWKMFVPLLFRPERFSSFQFFHPSFLYEALFNVLVLLIIYRLSRYKMRPGSLFLTYLFLYTMGRFFLENSRTDSVIVGGLRLNSLVSIGLFVLALIGFYAINYRKVSLPN